MLPDRYDDDKREYMRYSIFQACAIDDIAVSAEYMRVLAALGSYASKRNDYWCWAGLDKIAKRTGVSKSAVSQAVNKLATLGYIELHHDYDSKGKQISNAYRLIMDYVLPPERDRSAYDRPRAGIGGRKKSEPTPEEGLLGVNEGVNSELTRGLTQSVNEGVNSELPGGLTQSVNQIWEYETEKLRNREDESARVSFQSRKTGTRRAESAPHFEPNPDTPLTIETNARTPDPSPPIAPPPPPRTVGEERFLYWAQVRSLVEKRFGGGFIHNYVDRCKLYERAPGDYALVCPTAFVQEQIMTRARAEIVLQLAAVVREHVELEVIVA